jgi:hypothetical protein
VLRSLIGKEGDELGESNGEALPGRLVGGSETGEETLQSVGGVGVGRERLGERKSGQELDGGIETSRELMRREEGEEGEDGLPPLGLGWLRCHRRVVWMKLSSLVERLSVLESRRTSRKRVELEATERSGEVETVSLIIPR